MASDGELLDTTVRCWGALRTSNSNECHGRTLLAAVRTVLCEDIAGVDVLGAVQSACNSGCTGRRGEDADWPCEHQGICDSLAPFIVIDHPGVSLVMKRWGNGERRTTVVGVNVHPTLFVPLGDRSDELRRGVWDQLAAEFFDTVGGDASLRPFTDDPGGEARDDCFAYVCAYDSPFEIRLGRLTPPMLDAAATLVVQANQLSKVMLTLHL